MATNNSRLANFRFKHFPFLATICFGTLAAPTTGLAQTTRSMRLLEDTTRIQEVNLRDGTRLIGRILSFALETVEFRTVSGVAVDFAVSDVSTIHELRGVVREGEFWPDDGSDSRLFLAPTARVPAPGEGYFGVYELFVPSFGAGVGSNAMISGGMSIVPGASLDEQVFYVAPKFQFFERENVIGAVGLFWVKPGSSNGSAGMVFGTVTAGSDIASLSATLAFPFSSRSGFLEQQVISVGAEVRAASDLKFITENWFSLGNGESVFSFGVRAIGRKASFEVAAATSTEELILFPVVNVSFNW